MIRLTTSLLILALLILAALPLFADPPQPVVVDAVTDRYRPLPFDQEKLAGLLAKRMRANSEGHLEHVGNAPFLPATAGSISAADFASLQQAGRFLEAAVHAYEYRHDEDLLTVMNRVAKELIAAAQAAIPGKDAAVKGPRESSKSGATRQPSLGNSSESDEQDRARVHEAGRQTTTGASEEPGDDQQLLAHKYDLLGLLAYYRVTDDEDALMAARKIGDALLRTLRKNTAGHDQYRAAAGLIEPLVFLYRYTEENRYLEFCKLTADAWLQSKETHADPTVANLSALCGLVELYRVTGDESYFRPAPAAWLEVRNKWLSLAGTPLSNGEGAGADDDEEVGDTCATLAWMQLTLNLLRVTGDAQYAGQLERTVYNQLFANQDGNSGAILAPAPLNGTKRPAAGTDSCASSEAQGVALIPAAVWGRYGNGIAVLLYNAGRATFQLRRRGTVQLYSETTFPESGEFLLHVEPGHNLRFPLRLRVPEWTSRFTADVAGSHLIGKPGDFLTLNREWKPGDTVKISMDMTVHVLTGSAHDPSQMAVERGPQVLALAKGLNPQVKDLAEVSILTSDASQPKLTPVTNKLPPNWPGDQAYSIAGEYAGKTQQLTLAPFADAKSYRVWLKRPSPASGSTK